MQEYTKTIMYDTYVQTNKCTDNWFSKSTRWGSLLFVASAIIVFAHDMMANLTITIQQLFYTLETSLIRISYMKSS